MPEMLVRYACLPCEGRGSLSAPQQALRVLCGACDGRGYREQWESVAELFIKYTTKEVIDMGGKPSKGTPADKRIKGNKPPVKKS